MLIESIIAGFLFMALSATPIVVGVYYLSNPKIEVHHDTD